MSTACSRRGRACPDAVRRGRHEHAHLGELAGHDLHVVELRAVELDLASCHRARDEQCADLDPVADQAHLRGFERLDAVHLDARRAPAEHVPAHPVQARAQLGDLGLARGVVDDGDAFGQRARHEQVLRGAHARELEHMARGKQGAVGVGDHITVLLLDHRAHRPKTFEVHVELARPDRVAARQGDTCLTATGEERAEHVDRRAHARHELVRGHRFEIARRVDRELRVTHPVDRCADHA